LFFRTGDASLARGLAIEDLRTDDWRADVDAGSDEPRPEPLRPGDGNAPTGVPEPLRPGDEKPDHAGCPDVHRPGWECDGGGFWRPKDPDDETPRPEPFVRPGPDDRGHGLEALRTESGDGGGAGGGLDGVGPDEAFAYQAIFAAEGGVAVDPNSGASGGITPGTLKDLQDRGKTEIDAEKPDDLTMEQRAQFMRDYFDDALGRIGGHDALGEIGDKQGAAAVGDALYRHGPSGGAGIVRDAINEVKPGAVKDETGRLGQQSKDALKDIMADPETKREFLERLGSIRNDRTRERDWPRNDFFRFRGTW
jgi:hypothetical protein